PLLQNHWLMVIHPPFLYMGYIGLTLPFAFALATLIEKDFSGPWLAVMRRWSLFAWSFLSMAIVLGGWWSYEVLGWGGYWAWDPVENASFMPWLSGTAFIHSLIVQEKRKMLAGWNLTLAVMTFLLTLLGTFLTRSGVLESVHSFTQSAVGPYFLVFIGIALVVSLSLLFWRASHLRQPGRIENIFSLEVLFLFNNLLFVSFCFIVFLGTFYPLIVEAVRGQKISVGEPYFNQMTVPITGMILLLMGVALMTPWKKTNLRVFLNTAKIPAVIAVVMTVVSLLLGVTKPAVVIVIFLSSFAFLVMLIEVIRTGPLFEKKLRRYSGFVSHAGALMIIVAVAISATYGYKGEVTLKKGESKNMAGYTLTLDDLTGEQVPQRFEVRAMMGIMKGKKSQDPLIPRMNYYPNSREPIASPAVRSTPTEDLYLTLLNVDKEGRQASFRVIVTPAVVWIWVGGVVVMMGGFLALALGKKNTSLPHE
ncbi:MAG: cytochrome c biogenesis protein CcsA, partial [Deltaproteobacteria bacterium]|nr:cytochrome c biogenesis protein CcsA [Deltaproteobacteria bacterium]